LHFTQTSQTRNQTNNRREKKDKEEKKRARGRKTTINQILGGNRGYGSPHLQVDQESRAEKYAQTKVRKLWNSLGVSARSQARFQDFP